jgi:hypothetical protein
MDLQEIIQSARARIGERDRSAARETVPANRAWLQAGELVRRHYSVIQRVLEGYAERSTATGPCDRDKAERAVSAAYAAIDRLPPRFIWFESPLAAAGAAALLSLDHASTYYAPADWENMRGQLGYQDKALLSSLFLDGARGSWNAELAESIFRMQNDLEIAFTDHDGRIASSLVSRWHNEWARTDLPDSAFELTPNGGRIMKPPPMIFPENELPDEYGRVMKGLDSFCTNSKGQLFVGLLWAMMRRQHQFNRLAACRLGSGDAWELAVIEACDLFGQGKGPAFKPLSDTMRECGWWWPFASTCVMLERPTQLILQSWRLHCTEGPAVTYPDNCELFFLTDLMVPERIALGDFSAGEIDMESNVELRRVMIDRFGVERYLFATGAERVHEDDCGVLYRKVLTDDEAVTVVQVINSTPEPDGTFKHYFLRVPPTMMTARAAVAWTFGLDEEDYFPTLQT